MVDTDKYHEESLEQVAAYFGHRPWREFCAITAELDALKAELETLRGKTQCCMGCDALARERDALKAEVTALRGWIRDHHLVGYVADDADCCVSCLADAGDIAKILGEPAAEGGEVG